MAAVSEQRVPRGVEVPKSALHVLAAEQHAEPVRDLRELRAEVWESDEELDAFLADLRASRDATAG